jgi:hypothetical protein
LYGTYQNLKIWYFGYIPLLYSQAAGGGGPPARRLQEHSPSRKVTLALLLPMNTVLATAAVGIAGGVEQCPPGFKAHSPGFWCATQSKLCNAIMPAGARAG